MAAAYHHARPTLASAAPLVMKTSGLDDDGNLLELLLTGDDFGITDVSVWLLDPKCPSDILVLFSDPLCESDEQRKFEVGSRSADAAWSHGSIATDAPNGDGVIYGKELHLIVRVAGQDSDPKLFSFEAPVISTVSFDQTTWTPSAELPTIEDDAFGGGYAEGWSTSACDTSPSGSLQAPLLFSKLAFLCTLKALLRLHAHVFSGAIRSLVVVGPPSKTVHQRDCESALLL